MASASGEQRDRYSAGDGDGEGENGEAAAADSKADSQEHPVFPRFPSGPGADMRRAVTMKRKVAATISTIQAATIIPEKPSLEKSRVLAATIAA